MGRVLSMLSSPRSGAVHGRPGHWPGTSARRRDVPSGRHTSPEARCSTLSSSCASTRIEMEPTRRSARQPHLASMRTIYAEELPGLSPGLTSWTSRCTQSWGATPGCSARLARARPEGARDTARVPVLGVEAHPGAGAQPRGVPLDAQLAARDHEMMPLRPSPPSGSSSQHQGTPSHWAKHLGAQPVVLSASRGCSGHSQGAGAGRRRAPHDRPSAPGACHSTLSS